MQTAMGDKEVQDQLGQLNYQQQYDRSRKSMPSTLKISEEGCSTKSWKLDSPRSRVSSIDDVGSSPTQIHFQSDKAEDDGKEQHILVEVRGNIVNINIQHPDLFETSCNRISTQMGLDDFTIVCLKMVLAKKLRQNDCRYAAVFRTLTRQYLRIRYLQLSQQPS